jgi:fibro-slime domain-containing protein
MSVAKVVLRKLIPPLAAAAVALSGFAARAEVITMSATYFTIAENDQDMNHQASGVLTNEVQNGLGADGLPILNTATYGCITGCFTNTPVPQDLTASGEITWWSPSLNNGGGGGTSDVVQTGTGTITLPYSNTSFFPTNGSGPDDENGFQAAIFSTVLNVPTTPESISFNVGADDDAFVYLDGNLVCDLGGVHGDAPGPCTSGTIGLGDHTLELFYADVNNTQAALTFDVTTADITGSPTPEPGTIALFGAGLAGLALIRRKRA